MGKYACYLVTVGLDIGVFTKWSHVGPLVKGNGLDHQSVYEGYHSLEEAEEAFEDAVARGTARRIVLHGRRGLPVQQPPHRYGGGGGCSGSNAVAGRSDNGTQTSPVARASRAVVVNQPTHSTKCSASDRPQQPVPAPAPNNRAVTRTSRGLRAHNSSPAVVGAPVPAVPVEMPSSSNPNSRSLVVVPARPVRAHRSSPAVVQPSAPPPPSSSTAKNSDSTSSSPPTLVTQNEDDNIRSRSSSRRHRHLISTCPDLDRNFQALVALTRNPPWPVPEEPSTDESRNNPLEIVVISDDSDTDVDDSPPVSRSQRSDTGGSMSGQLSPQEQRKLRDKVYQRIKSNPAWSRNDHGAPVAGTSAIPAASASSAPLLSPLQSPRIAFDSQPSRTHKEKGKPKEPCHRTDSGISAPCPTCGRSPAPVLDTGYENIAPDESISSRLLEFRIDRDSTTSSPNVLFSQNVARAPSPAGSESSLEVVTAPSSPVGSLRGLSPEPRSISLPIIAASTPSYMKSSSGESRRYGSRSQRQGTATDVGSSTGSMDDGIAARTRSRTGSKQSSPRTGTGDLRAPTSLISSSRVVDPHSPGSASTSGRGAQASRSQQTSPQIRSSAGVQAHVKSPKGTSSSSGRSIDAGTYGLSQPAHGMMALFETDLDPRSPWNRFNLFSLPAGSAPVSRPSPATSNGRLGQGHCSSAVLVNQ